jgi:hypothetical protein
MKTSLALFTLSLLIAADGVHAKQAKHDDDEAGGPQAIQAMHHDEAGTVTYRGRSGGSAGEKFSLKIGPAHQGKSWVAVYVGANGCLGDMAGQATVRGDVLELTRDEDGNACSLTIHRSAAGATITENNCGFDRGPSCSFDTRGTTLHPLSAAKAPAAPAPLVQDRAKQQEWMFSAANGQAYISSGIADDGVSRFTITCGGDAPSVGFTFYPDGYHGQALNKVLDLEQPFVFEVRQASGNNQKFPIVAYFVADGGWTQEAGRHLTGSEASAFLDAVGQDGRLDLQTGKGVGIASWTLKGTSQMRESIRKVCNL